MRTKKVKTIIKYVLRILADEGVGVGAS